MITTQQGLRIIKLLNEMKVKDTLVRAIRNISEIEKKKKIVLQKLFKLKQEDEEITDELVTKLLNQNLDIAKDVSELDAKNEEITMSLVLDFVFALSNCEESFYKTMSEITDKKVADIKKEDITVTVRELVDVFKSEQFMGFFKSLMK